MNIVRYGFRRLTCSASVLLHVRFKQVLHRIEYYYFWQEGSFVEPFSIGR